MAIRLILISSAVALAIGCRAQVDPALSAPGADTQADNEQLDAQQAGDDKVADAASVAESPEESNLVLKKIDHDAYPSLHNLIQVSDKIYSGGEPENEQAFEELAKLGVKTVVSVDGARPDVETAQQHGLRYVHIPIGYDGVPQEAGEAFAQLVRTAEGPFFIHCHHGRHRGPAGAAVACIASGERNGRQALEILDLAGTSKDYPGLWRDVEKYAPPASDAELPELVSIAEVGSLAAAMALVDRSNDRLKLCAAEDWKAPTDHPDVSPPQEALLLKEGLVEAGRNLSDGYDQQFVDWMNEAAVAAERLEAALRNGDKTAAAEHFLAVAQSCKKCHARHRN